MQKVYQGHPLAQQVLLCGACLVCPLLIPQSHAWMLADAYAGIPEAGSVQEVLLWQTATIRMMYRIVAKAIERKVLYMRCRTPGPDIRMHPCVIDMASNRSTW